MTPPLRFSSLFLASSLAAMATSHLAAQSAVKEPYSKDILPLWSLSTVPLPAVPEGVQPGSVLSLAEEWRAAQVRPQPRQVAWQRQGFIAFVHFGPNTMTGREWGTGDEPESVFNPAKLDARQWVRSLKAAGVREVILTCKHHDGFCLWPSRFTDHSVKRSPWKDGKGDVLREVSDAVREEGLRLGVYLSPADLNAMKKGVYGRTPRKPGVIPTPVAGWTPKSAFSMSGEWDAYNTYFMNQLFETLSEYGPVSEVWFDGAQPKPGTGQLYDFADWYKLIRALQPGAMIFGRGPDCRWIGNEGGRTRPDEWSPIGMTPMDGFQDRTSPHLGTDADIKGAEFLAWHPGETDVSIRPGWFYHAAEDSRVRTLRQLLDYWYGAAGGNAILLLNVPPTPEGLFHPNDVRRLAELGAVLRATFSKNLAEGATVTTSPAGRPGADGSLTDGNPATGWAPADWNRTGEVILTLPAARTFNRISLMEDIAGFGQRVETHEIDVFIDGAWKTVSKAGTIGNRRIHRFGTVTSDKVRVRITGSRVAPSLSEVGLYFEPEFFAPPEVTRNAAGLVSIAVAKGARVRYTVDGSAPGASSPEYSAPFALPQGGKVSALAEPLAAGALMLGEPLATAEFDAVKTGWKVVSADGKDGAAAIDGKDGTVWKAAGARTLTVDMGSVLTPAGFTMTPKVPGPYVRAYEFFVSEDGSTWTSVASGEFDNIRNNPIRRFVPFTPVKARYFRFVAGSSEDGGSEATVAEIGVTMR